MWLRLYASTSIISICLCSSNFARLKLYSRSAYKSSVANARLQRGSDHIRIPARKRKGVHHRMNHLHSYQVKSAIRKRKYLKSNLDHPILKRVAILPTISICGGLSKDATALVITRVLRIYTSRVLCVPRRRVSPGSMSSSSSVSDVVIEWQVVDSS